MSISQMRGGGKAIRNNLQIGNGDTSPYRVGWKVCVSLYQIGNMNEGPWKHGRGGRWRSGF